SCFHDLVLFRRNLIFDPLSPLRRFCIELQDGGPAIGCVHRGAHSIRACAMAFEVPVLKIHSRRAARHRGETDFHFARLSQVGLVAPSVCDLPCQHKAARRLPDQDLAPVALCAIDLLALTPPAGAAFDNALLHRRLSYVVGARPPGVDSLREYLKGALCAGLHADALANRSFRSLVQCGLHCVSFGGAFFGGCSSSFFAGGSSTFSLNAVNALVPNPSKYSRSESNPSGLSW